MAALEANGRRPARLRAAQLALLDERATALMERVRGALCEATRTQILRVLAAGPLSVTEIASVIERSKWATSQHLRVLRQNGLVQPQRRGRRVLYSLPNSAAARSVLGALDVVVREAA